MAPGLEHRLGLRPEPNFHSVQVGFEPKVYAGAYSLDEMAPHSFCWRQRRLKRGHRPLGCIGELVRLIFGIRSVALLPSTLLRGDFLFF